LAGLAWVAIGTWAEARRASNQEDRPALRAGIEAELASRHCAGVRVDPERFRAFAWANGMSHEDFFMKRHSARLKHDIAMTTKQLRASPDQTCARLWTEYGLSGSKIPLLKRS